MRPKEIEMSETEHDEVNFHKRERAVAERQRDEAYRYAEEHIKRWEVAEQILDEERQTVGGALNELASAVLASASSPHSLVALANKARNALLCPKEVTPGGRKCVYPRGHEGRCEGC